MKMANELNNPQQVPATPQQPSVMELQSQVQKLSQQMMAEMAERSRLQQMLQSQQPQPQPEPVKSEDVDVDSILKEMQVDVAADANGSPRTIDNLSNRELLQVISQAVEGAIDGVKENAGKNFEKKFEELGNQFKTLQNGLTGIAAYINVADARAKFQDFDQYRPQIGAIIEKYPNMAIQDAYVLAKANVVGNAPPVNVTASERPTNIVTSPENNRVTPERVVNQINNVQQPSPKLRFRGLLDQAIDRVLKSQQQG